MRRTKHDYKLSQKARTEIERSVKREKYTLEQLQMKIQEWSNETKKHAELATATLNEYKQAKEGSREYPNEKIFASPSMNDPVARPRGIKTASTASVRPWACLGS